ncbi:cell division protein FtsA [Candidatus Wolfebacteria bacterium]|nr:cell division protein FtsA [Candidatus Wolfebacteria bacterium]
MARNIAIGIDIGTHHTNVVVAERGIRDGKSVKRVIGTGIATSKGLRHGYIVHAGDTVRSLAQAAAQAERAAQTKIRRAYLSIGGISLEGMTATGSVVISRADSEITEDDTARATDAAEASVLESIKNRKIIHTIPLEYRVDGKEILGRPAGMAGLKLEVKALLITCLTQHLDDFVQVVEEVGIEVEDVVASPLAAGMVNLTKTQKIAGVVLADIGAETVSIVVYENNLPISLKVFPIGSTAITNDIALGLKIPLEEAEEVKLASPGTTDYSRKQLQDIIEARLTDILELVEAHLKKIKKSGLLPAGIVITGGGSGVATLEDLAKAALKLPSKVAELSIASTKGVIRDPSWSVAYGLALLGLALPSEDPHGFRIATRRTRDSVLSWVKQFLP